MTSKRIQNRLLSTDEVAELLAVSPKTVRRWIAEGELPAVKLGIHDAECYLRGDGRTPQDHDETRSRHLTRSQGTLPKPRKPDTIAPFSGIGHFSQVEAGNGVLLDFADTDREPSGMHLAFLVTERQFDEIFDQIKKRGMPYWADPRRSEAHQINHHDGGRCVYFGDSYTNVGWEIITRPYGSGPRDEQTNVNETGQLRPDASQGDEPDE